MIFGYGVPEIVTIIVIGIAILWYGDKAVERVGKTFRRSVKHMKDMTKPLDEDKPKTQDVKG